MNKNFKKKLYNFIFYISFFIMITLSFIDKKLDDNPFIILLGLISSLFVLISSIKTFLKEKDS